VVAEPSRGFFSGNQPIYAAELDYSYSVAGRFEGGRYKREFATEREADEFLRDLKGKPVEVRYDPDKPSRSSLPESVIEELLRNRAPASDAQFWSDPYGTYLPKWSRPFLWLFVCIAALGLAVSLCIHMGTLMGRRVAPVEFLILMQVGIFVVWFPAVMAAQHLVGNPSRRDFWKAVLKGSPEWMRYVVYLLIANAALGSLPFMRLPRSESIGVNPSPEMWRGFSGVWMVFYSAAFAILYSAAHARFRGPGPESS
jgi:hypothetical protein